MTYEEGKKIEYAVNRINSVIGYDYQEKGVTDPKILINLLRDIRSELEPLLQV